MTRWFCIRAKGFYSWLGFKGVVVSVLRVITVLVGLYDYSLLISVFSLFKRGLIYVFNLFSSGPDSSGAGTDTGAAVAIKDSAAVLAVGGTDSFLSVCNSGEVAAIGSESVEVVRNSVVIREVRIPALAEAANKDAVIVGHFIQNESRLASFSYVKEMTLATIHHSRLQNFFSLYGLDPSTLRQLTKGVCTLPDGSVKQLVMYYDKVFLFEGKNLDFFVKTMSIDEATTYTESLGNNFRLDWFEKGQFVDTTLPITI